MITVAIVRSRVRIRLYGFTAYEVQTMEQASGMNRTGIDPSSVQGTRPPGVGSDLPAGGATSVSAIDFFLLECTGSYSSIPELDNETNGLESPAKRAVDTHFEMLINKLKERLAYERSGVRVYEQLIAKCEHLFREADADIQLPIERLMKFRDQEGEHSAMLTRCLEHLGVDPMARTSDSCVPASAISGMMKVIMDPRTSISQSLQATLAFELADNLAWESLINLAMDMGMSEMTMEFQHALMQEDAHLGDMREWYSRSLRTPVKMQMAWLPQIFSSVSVAECGGCAGRLNNFPESIGLCSCTKN